MTLASNSLMNRLATMGQWRIQWLYHAPLHNNYLRRANRYFGAEVQQCCDVLHLHGSSMMLHVLFQHLLDYGDDRVQWNRYEEGLHIIRCNALPFSKSYRFVLVQKVMGVPDVMWVMSYE